MWKRIFFVLLAWFYQGYAADLPPSVNYWFERGPMYVVIRFDKPLEDSPQSILIQRLFCSAVQSRNLKMLDKCENMQDRGGLALVMYYRSTAWVGDVEDVLEKEMKLLDKPTFKKIKPPKNIPPLVKGPTNLARAGREPPRALILGYNIVYGF